MNVNKRLAALIFLFSLNLAILYFIWNWVGVYFAFGLGLVVGLILTEGGPSNWKEFILFINVVVFWPVYFTVFVADDFYRLKNWIMKMTIDRPFVLERKVNKCIKEKYGIDVFSDVWFSDGKVVVKLQDYDKLTEAENDVLVLIANCIGVDKKKVKIYWDDEWRYEDW